MFNKIDSGTILLGKGDENPYSHLWEFEQTCACLHIAGMSDNLKMEVVSILFDGKS